jgi:hypothetical protein
METVPIGEAERLGNAVNALPVEVDRVAGKVIRMPAWTSFVFALVANPERAWVSPRAAFAYLAAWSRRLRSPLVVPQRA